MKLQRVILILVLALVAGQATALTFSQTPLFIASTEPRIMLVASKDHQLSIKAYTDYSDLDGDGVLDTTYKDSITYVGYFDSNRCYTYSTGNSRFEPSVAVTSGTHQCNGSTWSGNFLNWASMTRMDILRKTFYGGYRSTDTTSATVLERHFLPVDVHAFVKVYTPTGSMPSIQSLTGISGQTSISLCNVSDSTNTNLTGTSSFTIPPPSIKVASGAWPQWDSSEVTQCAVNIGNSTQPTSLLATVGSSGVLTARVQVCVAGKLESNCKTYTNPSSGAQTVKPIGLLQQYGDVDADRRVRFGLMTGSYAYNKSGGVLRKNATYLSNNNKAAINASTNCSTSSSATTVNGNADDEINVCTGQFINQGATDAGIINTLNRLHIAGFTYTSAGKNGKHQYSCNSPGILSFTNGQCVDWGNPLSEIYLESLRYFANAGVTTTFNANDSSILASLPQVTWADPLPATEWCALSNIVVLSTGLNSFDTDELASFTPPGGATSIDAATLTQTVGDASHENINGGTYLIGDNGSTANNQCTAKLISNLATAKGICPEVPSLQGGYGIAGLAYAPKTIDLRPAYASQRIKRWTGVNADWVLRQPLNTYAVQLAESLPSFSTPVGSGTVTLLPACQAGSSPNLRNCSMTNLIVDTNVAMASVGTDATAKTKTCSGNGTASQCFTVAWEDSTWGNDYDMDVIQRLGYCVGSACSSFKMLCPTTSSATATLGPWTVGSNDIVIATCTVQAQAGVALTLGYTLTGTTNDGAFFPILRPGNANFNVGSVLAAGITAPNAATFTQGASSASLLKNPLWYVAKYGGFTESTPSAGTPNPDLTSEWDAKINATGAPGSDGIPDNYFDVKNPANLAAVMATILDAASQPDASAASVATNTTTLQTKTRVFQAKFSSADWSGQLLSYPFSQATGQLGTPDWDAGSIINGQSPASRVILTKGSTGDGVAFAYGNLTGPTGTSGTQKNLLDKVTVGTTTTVDNCGPERVAYLRGDNAHEGATGSFTCASGSTISNFRVRTSKLGDIINSNPWYVGAPAAGYSDVDYKSYSIFRAAKINRTPVVYVAANDGMVHGFNAELDFTSNPAGVATANSGKEVLGYVPSGSYANLSLLTHKSFNKDHRYIMDGSPLVGDADVAADGTTTYTPDWRSVLVGGLGAGGMGYYALDVSDPSTFSESGTAPASTLLWEFGPADDADVGYAFNAPPAFLATNYPKQMVRMANGKWAVILGNGYNSTSGKAVLYILFIKEGMDGVWTAGADYIKIVADSSGSNGLSTPVPFDMDGDGTVDVVYAGDLKGNLWKFLVGDANPANWQVDFSTANCGASSSCVPLFVAQDAASPTPNRQPIIWPPEVTTHPAGGAMVLFGTGKYLESGDVGTTSVQTYYGVWDNNDASIATTGTPAGNRTNGLAQLSVSTGSQTVGGVTYGTRSVTGTPSTNGWYLDLPTSGERATGIPKLVNGILYFNTFIPSSSPCDSGGTGWLMAVNYFTGATPSHQVFTQFGTTPLAGVQFGAALGGTTLIQSSGSSLGYAVMSLTQGNIATLGNTSGAPQLNFGPYSRGRVNWREIVQ